VVAAPGHVVHGAAGAVPSTAEMRTVLGDATGLP
jgi:hypothetical protein